MDSETVDYSTYGVRPVINISPDVVITGGDGVINTNWNNESGPYILNEDKSTNITGKLSENSTNGEYVLLAGKKYRIVDYDSNGNTKLILDGYYEENGEVFEMEYGSNNVFSTSRGIGQKLNGDVLNWLVPTTTDRNKLVTYTWYQNTFNYGDSYEVSLNETSPYRTTSAMVGTIRIGELLAAQPDSIITNGYTMSDEWSLYGYWTAMPFTYYGDNATLWIIFEESEFADGPASNILALRPVIVVNSNVNITGGTGTWSNPYQI